MTKVILQITKIILVIILFLFTISCKFIGGGEKGSGNVVTEERKVSQNFTHVAVSTSLDAIIVQSSNTSVSVEADDNLQKLIKTEVENNELKIFVDGNMGYATKAEITVHMPTIKGLSASSSASLETKNSITADNLSLNVSSSGDMIVNVKANSINCNTGSSADLTIEGSTNQLTIEAASSSDVNASRLTAQNVTVNASSSSSVTVNPIKSLNAKASSSADILYKNRPQSIKEEEFSSGSISEL
ncbi:lipoprotein [Flavobacterium suaedae]|uniref:Lipoprotein n=1 Tax=Flavobacterium suaedae TaxID=1767027 RepID=A0ABQ1JRN5_9FLAO|nr:head GIN domain-containing protein [Flavobacterium suaedae]GGB75543.1 lipoprotein [Flavobacterium suaedae]